MKTVSILTMVVVKMYVCVFVYLLDGWILFSENYTSINQEQEKLIYNNRSQILAALGKKGDSCIWEGGDPGGGYTTGVHFLIIQWPYDL